MIQHAGLLWRAETDGDPGHVFFVTGSDLFEASDKAKFWIDEVLTNFDGTDRPVLLSIEMAGGPLVLEDGDAGYSEKLLDEVLGIKRPEATP